MAGADGCRSSCATAFPGINTLRPLSFFFLCYGVLLVVLVLFAVIRDSRFGAALQAARQNEVRVASVGIAPYRIRLATFVISADHGPGRCALCRSQPLRQSLHAVVAHVGRVHSPDHSGRRRPSLRTRRRRNDVRYVRLPARRLDRSLAAVPGPDPARCRTFARGGLMGWLAGKARHG